MSTVATTIILETPKNLCRENTTEVYTGIPVSCNYCHGVGYLEIEKSRDKCEKKACSICAGSGKLIPRIKIEWLPEFDK